MTQLKYYFNCRREPPLSIDTQEVHRIARLARLDLSEEEARAYAEDLVRILELVAEIGEIEVDPETDGEPWGPPALPAREDRTRPGLDRSRILEMAPDAAGGLFRVPAVLPSRGEDRPGSDS